MSTINKKPFIKSLIEDLKENDGYLESLQLLIDGSGNQIPLLRTLSIKPSGNRTNITVADVGVHLCNLEANYSLYNGYLCFTDNYCVLISFTDSQKLTMFMITDGGHNFETIDEELSVLELRSELMDISGGGGSGGGSGLPDTTPTITLTSETITLAFNEGVLPTHIKLSNGIIVDLQGNEYCAEGDETVAQSINSGRIVIVVSGDFTSLPSVDMTNLVWTLIDNPSNFSFDDLPRFSDSSDVDDFPGGEGGGGIGFEEDTIDFYFSDFTMSGEVAYLTNAEKLAKVNALIEKANQNKILIGTVEPPVLYGDGNLGELDTIGNVHSANVFAEFSEESTEGFMFGSSQVMFGFVKLSDLVVPYITTPSYPNSNYATRLLQLLATDSTKYIRFKVRAESDNGGSGGGSGSSESSYTTISIAWSTYDIRFLLPKFEETQFVTNLNEMISGFNQLMSLSLPTISSYADLETLYSAISGQLYENVVLGGIIWAINYDSVSVQCCADGPLEPVFTKATLDLANQTVEWSIDVLSLNNGSLTTTNVVSDTNFSSPNLFKVDDLSF